LINQWQAGVLLEDFSEEDYLKAARQIEAVVREPSVRKSARSIAEQVFNLKTIAGERYASLYEKVLEQD
jgi:AAA+ ATPase superfamily predicted ATPase